MINWLNNSIIRAIFHYQSQIQIYVWGRRHWSHLDFPMRRSCYGSSAFSGLSLFRERIIFFANFLQWAKLFLLFQLFFSITSQLPVMSTPRQSNHYTHRQTKMFWPVWNPCWRVCHSRLIHWLLCCAFLSPSLLIEGLFSLLACFCMICISLPEGFKANELQDTYSSVWIMPAYDFITDQL